MKEIEPKDLSGDPVYDYLKTKTAEGCTIIGGVIRDNLTPDPKAPKKIIELTIERKTIEKYAYSYNKVKRDMEEKNEQV